MLGDHAAAAEGFRRAIADMPAGFWRDKGVYLAREAAAHAGGGDADEAATIGMQALIIGAETRSGRIKSELQALHSTLTQWNTPTVEDFCDAMSAARSTG